MMNTITPIHLGSRFPCNEVMFFGEVLRESGDSKETGYVATNVQFPKQTDVLIFKMEEVELWKSFVPSDVPEIMGTEFNFRRTREAAEARLVNRVIAEKGNLDVFYVEGGPLMFVRQCEEGYRVFNSSLLLQSLDLYSRLLRKTYSASLTKPDYRAARDVALEISEKMGKETGIERLDLEKKLRDIFTCLVADALREAE